VTYSYDSNGRIQVSAVELTGKRQANIDIIRSQGLDNQGVDAFQQIAREYHVE
jgi:molecular chaperone DnaK (HSP70)